MIKFYLNFISLIMMYFITTSMFSTIFAQSNIYHSPYGYDNLYDEREIEIEGFRFERVPRDPIENDEVIIKFRTDKNSDIKYAVEYQINGNKRELSASILDFEDENYYYWVSSIGSFKKGEEVNYRIISFQNELKKEQSPKFTFKCFGWDYIKDVKDIVYSKDAVHFKCSSTNESLSPIVTFELSSRDYINIKIQVNQYVKREKLSRVKNKTVEYKDSVTISFNDNSYIKAAKYPFSYSITNKSENKVLKEYQNKDHGAIGFLNDGTGKIFSIKECFYSPDSEKFYGFGERYNSFDQRGNKLDNYVVNIWKDQDKKSYIPIPFYFTNNDYGLFVKSYYYSQFDLDSEGNNKCVIKTNFGRKEEGSLDYYLFWNMKPREIIGSYTDLTGKPEAIPVWTLGPWISANEWDKQSEIESQIDSLSKYDIPNGVVVIEAWSDEETFYIFNDAEYEPKDGSQSFRLTDFKFKGRWPDPIGMINNLHDKNMRMVLWNIPVLKYSHVDNKQRDIDEKHAIECNYVVRNPDGTPFRMPPSWFGNSLCLDYTNNFAVAWWMNKRRYLIEELKVDGLRCDGGEFIWGRDLMFSDGSRGEEMRNKYPHLYVRSYHDFIKSVNKDGVVFHRAGTFGVQNHPLAWNGDQKSSFPTFKEAIRSCINLSISGVPFVAYDIAGYHDESELTSDLYKRSLAQATFSPIMQSHSAYGGDPKPSLERTPWNLAKLLNDKSCIEVYKKYANVRYNIIPYIYSEMNKTSESGIPLMSPLFIEYPNLEASKENDFNYLFGSSLLVCPIVEPNTSTKNISLPPGNWFDLWSGKKYEGNIQVQTPHDHIPVFAKEGSIIPLNLNQNFELGNQINNDLNNYTNLTFYIYLTDTSFYYFDDYTTSEEKLLTYSNNDDEIIINVPKFECSVNFIIGNVSNNKELHMEDIALIGTKEEFLNSEEGLFFNTMQNNYYLKLKPENTGKEIFLYK